MGAARYLLWHTLEKTFRLFPLKGKPKLTLRSPGVRWQAHAPICPVCSDRQGNDKQVSCVLELHTLFTCLATRGTPEWTFHVSTCVTFRGRRKYLVNKHNKQSLVFRKYNLGKTARKTGPLNKTYCTYGHPPLQAGCQSPPGWHDMAEPL